MRIRLAGTQRVVAIALLSDGSCWSAEAEVVVTAGACLDEMSL
jgi:sulfur-oxidizing protein SoxY